ncbi:MAG TPA: hypothetical protein H9730_01805, partial [Candidatus Mediterraneibacter stercoripullorum]|nr:hypothetical protein [Candidatus Mediterraneibacter stercoripullorum]
SADLSSDFKEKLEEMLQKYRGETINFDLRKVRKFKVFEFPRPDIQCRRWRTDETGQTDDAGVWVIWETDCDRF